MKSLNHHLTIELTSEQMRELTLRASAQGYLPVAYLKFLATTPHTITHQNYQTISEPSEKNTGKKD